MFCKNCGKLISDDADFCPECGAQQNAPPAQINVQAKKKHGGFVALGVILVFVVIIGIGALLSSDPPVSDTPAALESERNTPAVSATEKNTPVPSEPEETAPATPESEGEGAIGDYYVKILGVARTTDYDGNPAVVVTFNWTNNSDKAASFMWSTNTQVFQGGIECETAFIFDSDVYSAENSMLDIKPGASLDVQSAFVLRDAETPISVEVSELISWDDTVITKDFDIV
jgi:hypothetical protein